MHGLQAGNATMTTQLASRLGAQSSVTTKLTHVLQKKGQRRIPLVGQLLMQPKQMNRHNHNTTGIERYTSGVWQVLAGGTGTH
jgi:hypothetical protein